MYYSAIGLLAVLILLIENQDILYGGKGVFGQPVWRMYRKFLFAVLAYCVVDALWGLFEGLKLPGLLFADTTVYFVAMAVGVLSWAEFMAAYLEEGNEFGRFLVFVGRTFAGIIAALTLLNIFAPVLFTVEADCVYRALPLRYVILASQILLLLLSSFYAYAKLRNDPAAVKTRYHALALFGEIMALFLIIQLWFPYLPLYAAGYLLGTCLLHTYVVSDEQEAYRQGLEAAEKVRRARDTVVSLLDNLPAMAFTKDAETGVYLACNQSFADYAHKETPEGVAGLTDAEIFDPETAAHFTADDRLALSMDKPYIFREDVPDAEGNPRRLQTTKLKYTDFAGRLCVLGLCQDATDMVPVQREDAATKEDYEKARSTGIIYSHISSALTRGFITLYYVHLDTEEYIEYRNDPDSDALIESRRGWHFFETFRVEAETMVHPDDRPAVIKAMRRKNMEAALEQNGSFVITYRLGAGKDSRFYSLKVTRSEDDERRVILGVSDVDEHMRRSRAELQAREEQTAYSRINALTGDYLYVYIVDPKTGRYREVHASQGYGSFGQAKEGEDFFTAVREAAKQFSHPDDLNRFLSTFTPENVMAEIKRRGIFTVSYRLLQEGQPLYVQLKAAMVEEKEGARLIAGINDIDAQVRQEEEYVKRMALARINVNVDPLTGVKNRHAYLELEKRLNGQIEKHQAPACAIVLLDLNDLKKINDTSGHNAGDQYIRDACKFICDTFKHSPVFRVGGDEFVVISQGDDYDRIDELVEQMDRHNRQALENGGIVIACGMAKYQGEPCVAALYEQADRKMYENKSALKAKKRG